MSHTTEQQSASSEIEKAVESYFQSRLNLPKQQPTPEPVVEIENDQLSLGVAKGEFLKHILQIAYYNFNFLVAFLGGKMHFGLQEHLTITQISWLINLVHFLFAQNLISFVAANKSLISKTNSFAETLNMMIMFGGGSQFMIYLVLSTEDAYPPIKGFASGLFWIVTLVQFCFPSFFAMVTGQIKATYAKVRSNDGLAIAMIVQCLFFGIPTLAYFYPKLIFWQGNVDF